MHGPDLRQVASLTFDLAVLQSRSQTHIPLPRHSRPNQLDVRGHRHAQPWLAMSLGNSAGCSRFTMRRTFRHSTANRCPAGGCVSGLLPSSHRACQHAGNSTSNAIMLLAAASRRFVLSNAKIPLSRRRPPREIRLGSSAGLRPADLRYQRLRLGGLAKPRQQPPFGSSRTDSVNSHEAHQHHDPCREFGNGGDRPAQDEAARIEQRVREIVGAELVRRDVILIGRAVCDRIDVEEEASRAAFKLRRTRFVLRSGVAAPRVARTAKRGGPGRPASVQQCQTLKRA